MKTVQDIQDIISDNMPYLRSKFSIKEIGIFGSFVRRENASDSDLDVLVEFSKPVGLFDFLELEEELANLLGLKVDLVSKKGLKPHIGQHILQEVIYV